MESFCGVIELTQTDATSPLMRAGIRRTQETAGWLMPFQICAKRPGEYFFRLDLQRSGDGGRHAAAEVHHLQVKRVWGCQFAGTWRGGGGGGGGG